MTLPVFVCGSPQWMTAVAALWAIASAAVLWSYARAQAPRGVRMGAAILKGLGITLLLLILLEPLLTGKHARPHANAFVVLADNSQSLLIRDEGADRTRGDWVRELLTKDPEWQTRLGQDFNVREYAFDTHLRSVDGFDGLTFDGTGSALGTSLSLLARRFQGLPLAGILVFTDGIRTDVGDVDWSGMPPIYPVVPPSQRVARDVRVDRVSVSQTNFESAPVVIAPVVSALGFPGETIVATISDETGKVVERQEARSPSGDKPIGFRFQFRPERKGISFYRVNVCTALDEDKAGESSAPAASGEQTRANNSRLVVVDQGSGPYRVLYVSGRPNWEFKFLRRAITEDEQVELVGLVRIARRQPKFDFRSRRTRSTNPFFDGFDNPDADTAERSDQPVLVRLGAADESELRDGFPQTADLLYGYHAIVLDDVEATFFTPDQLTLLRNFVSQRGGGLLMLGGPDSFGDGQYDKTPVSELLPVYLSRSPESRDDARYRVDLTREGMLQPWVRSRKTEDEERQRLTAMPEFHTMSRAGTVKPGAVVLADAVDRFGNKSPALVAHQFGRGHVAALLIGDLWRWGMRRADPAESDLERTWRQTIRWLVGDVPGRLQITAQPRTDSTTPAVDLTVRVRDAEYRPLDNARVTLRIKLPDGSDLTLEAEPDRRESGVYSAAYTTKQSGAYRVVATATAPDGSAVGEQEAGWVAQPAADEFARLEPDKDFLSTIAAKTHGELVDGQRLAAFVSGLPLRNAPITETWTSPLWHHPLYLIAALFCLAAEWGLRRKSGLA
ncbi:MAG: glutamine amidotransferase [Isosphaeraceae bacterium]